MKTMRVSGIKIEVPYRWFIFSRKLVDKIEGLNFSIPRTPNGIMTGEYKDLELMENDVWYEYKGGKVFKDKSLHIIANEKNKDLNYEELEDLWISTEGFMSKLNNKENI